jgi:hypothetical protein
MSLFTFSTGSFSDGGKDPNSSAYVKTFPSSVSAPTWIVTNYNNQLVITTTIPKIDVYLQKDLFVDGNIIQLSDARFKENIVDLPESALQLLMQVKPRQYEFKSKNDKGVHYGFIAQELEELFPSLVKKSVNSITKAEVKAVNYLEFIPLLLMKIQDLQKQIDVLKSKMV